MKQQNTVLHIISGVEYVLDTLGDKELENEFKILKNGGSLVSLRGLPNGEFARRLRCMGAVPKIKDFDRTSSLAASFALSCEKYPRKI